MPPKPELTRDKIAAAAFELTRIKGMEALTARSVAQALGCSTQPIYSLYGGVEELKSSVYEMAAGYMKNRMLEPRDKHHSPALNLAIGFLYFAQEEKELFRTLYLSGFRTYRPRQDLFLGEELTTHYLRYSKRLHHVAEAQLKAIFLKLTVYMIGIGTMLNSGTLELAMEEAVEMVREMYEMLLRQEGLTYPIPTVKEADEP